jgi:hypothetical protein
MYYRHPSRSSSESALQAFKQKFFVECIMDIRAEALRRVHYRHPSRSSSESALQASEQKLFGECITGIQAKFFLL